jgi:hypothetical protein
MANAAVGNLNQYVVSADIAPLKRKGLKSFLSTKGCIAFGW